MLQQLDVSDCLVNGSSSHFYSFSSVLFLPAWLVFLLLSFLGLAICVLPQYRYYIDFKSSKAGQNTMGGFTPGVGVPTDPVVGRFVLLSLPLHT